MIKPLELIEAMLRSASDEVWVDEELYPYEEDFIRLRAHVMQAFGLSSSTRSGGVEVRTWSPHL